MRSTDRKMSLLNYVVNTVKTHFPELHSFADGLHLLEATQGLYNLLEGMSRAAWRSGPLPFNGNPRAPTMDFLSGSVQNGAAEITLLFLVSKQTLNNDIQSLKKGIDLTKKERDKQPDNFVLFVSFLHRTNVHLKTSFSPDFSNRFCSYSIC